MDLAAGAVDDEALIKSHRRQSRLAARRHLLLVFLETLNMCPENGAFRFVLAGFELSAKVGNLVRHVVKRLFQPWHAELLQPFARLHRRDHLDTAAENRGVGFVAHGMVTVQVAVDYIPNGNLGDLVPDLFDQGFRGRGFRVGVDDQNVVAIDDDRRVAVQHRGRLRDRAVDAVCDLLEVEERGLSLATRRRLVVVSNRPDQRSQRRAARGRDKSGGRHSTQNLAARRLNIRSGNASSRRARWYRPATMMMGMSFVMTMRFRLTHVAPRNGFRETSNLMLGVASESSIPCPSAQHNLSRRRQILNSSAWGVSSASFCSPIL